MARYAEISMRFTVPIENIKYKDLREWSERLHKVTKRRISRCTRSQLTVRTWSQDG